MKKIFLIVLIVILLGLVYAAINSRQEGYRVIPRTVTTIYGGNNGAICKVMVNECGTDMFVPTKSDSEWQNAGGFIPNHPSCVMMRSCITNPLSIKCNTRADYKNWWYYKLNTTVLETDISCTQSDLLLNNGLTWWDPNAEWLGPVTDCDEMGYYYYLYSTFYVPSDNALVEVAAMADDSLMAWIWKNMDKNQEINNGNPIISFYPNTNNAWRCGPKYWKTTTALPKGWHTIVLLIDDKLGGKSAGILSIKVNNTIVLSSKNDGSWCGWGDPNRENSNDHKINPNNNICIENYGSGL